MFFLVEMIMNIIVMGLIAVPNTYLRDLWGWVNGLSVVISII